MLDLLYIVDIYIELHRGKASSFRVKALSRRNVYMTIVLAVDRIIGIAVTSSLSLIYQSLFVPSIVSNECV